MQIKKMMPRGAMSQIVIKPSAKKDGYYIVNFNNQKNKVLYVLISDQGKVFDANFSGTFEGLEG